MFLSGYVEKVVTANLDVNLTVHLDESLNLAIAEPYSLQADLDMEIKAVDESRVVGLDIVVEGLTERSADLDLIVRAQQAIVASLDANIKAKTSVESLLNMFIKVPLTYRYMRLRKDLATRYFGGFDSDPAFFEGFDPPNPSAIVTADVGYFSDSHRSLIYITPNDIPAPGTFDKYSLPLDSPLTIDTVGFRAVVAFRISQIGPNNSLIFGLCNDQLSPLTNIGAGSICAFAFEAEQDHVWFRAFYGTADSELNIGSALPIHRFLNNDLLVEMELIDVGVVYTVEIRLYERDRDLDVPLKSFIIQTSVPPAVDRFFISSLGRRFAHLPTSQPNMSVSFEYVDVERGTGVLYEPDPDLGIETLRAKWRAYQDRPPLLLRAIGKNRIYCSLSPDGVLATTETWDDIELDPSQPVIHVVELHTDSPVFVPYAVTPPIPKGSLQPGFSGVRIKWFANQPGNWTLRVRSTGHADGEEIASGRYDTPGIYNTINWDLSSIGPLDGVFDVTLYLVNDAGIPTATGIGEYILPFQPKLGSAMNLAVAEPLSKSTDLDVSIA